MIITNDEVRILRLVNIFANKHNLRNSTGGESVMQSDSAQLDAVELAADIADILAGDEEGM